MNNDQKSLQEALTKLTELAQERNEAIASDLQKNRQSKMDDILFSLLRYQLADGTIFYGLQLPRCFPSMIQPDILSILEWYLEEGVVIRGTSNDLMKVHTTYGDIELPMPPALRGSRVAHIVKTRSEQVQMGDLLAIFQARTNQPQKRKMTRQNVA